MYVDNKYLGQVIYGSESNDWIDIVGGTANKIFAAAGSDDVAITAGNNYIYGETGSETIIVRGGQSYISGEEGADIIKAYSGNNYINGGNDSDYLNIYAWGESGNVLVGAQGNDKYIMTTAVISSCYVTIDQTSPTRDNDKLTFQRDALSDFYFSYDRTLDNGTLTLTHKSGGVFNIRGWNDNPLAEIIFSDGSVVIPSDISRLITTSGFQFKERNLTRNDDTFDIQNNDNGYLVKAGSGDDVIGVNSSNNVIYGAEGNDIIRIYSDNNRVYGDDGNDYLNIYWGANAGVYLNGGAGRDTYCITMQGNKRMSVVIDQNSTGRFEWDSVFMNRDASTDYKLAFYDGDLYMLHNSGGMITVKGYESNHLDKITFSDCVLYDADIRDRAIVMPDPITRPLVIPSTNGKDAFVLDWVEGGHWILDQTSTKREGDTLTINNLKSTDAQILFIEDYDLVISDSKGSSLKVSGWGTNMFSYIVFADKKIYDSSLYKYIWQTYDVKALKGNIILVDPVFVNFDCSVNRTFGISTDGNGKVIVNMNKVNDALVNFESDKKNFTVTVVNNWQEVNKITASFTIEEVDKNETEKINIGDSRTLFFIKSGDYNLTQDDLNIDNDLVFTGNSASAWNVTVGAGNANLYFNQAQIMAGDKVVSSFDSSISGRNLIVSYNNGSDKIGNVTLTNFFDASGKQIANQEISCFRHANTSAYDKIALKVGSANADTISLASPTMYLAGAGNDIVTCGVGSYVNGDAGNDTIYSKGSYVNANGGIGDDTIHLGYNTTVEYNQANGGAGNDKIYVKGNYNSVLSEAGDDIITVTGNNNTAYGGEGKDTFTLSGNNNSAYGENGSDTVTISSGNSNYVSTGADNDIITITAGETNKVYGDAGDDTIYIKGGTSNTAYGGDGADYMEITNGTSNTLNGGSGNNQLYIKAGTKGYAYGGADVDTIRIQGGESNYAYGRDGNDLIKIEGGNKQSVNGDGGNDIIHVLAGTGHYAHGGAGNDVIYIKDTGRNIGTTTAYGDAGNDIFHVNSTANGLTLYGGQGSDMYDINWTLGDKVTVKNSDYAAGDIDGLNLSGRASDFTLSYNATSKYLLLTDRNGGTVRIDGWATNALDIRFAADNKVYTAAKINNAIKNLNNASISMTSVGAAYTSTASVSNITSYAPSNCAFAVS